ncbi:lactonase family protein [Haloferula rosea]|uniref:Lactonase family protein n=1 Tax=Haloferula rosea TaxID=490093 RepID=A0A934RBB8_9BACT|nr:lactonase family protein [Haloferula rosea]MBK1826179.1 lactonase family protein [Haloferula rosea]
MHNFLSHPLVVFTGLVLGTASAESVRVYFGTGGNEGIHSALLDEETGELRGMKMAVEASGAGFLALSKDGRSLYSTASGKDRQGAVNSYEISPEGALELRNSQPSMGRGACFVGLDQTNQMVMVANYGSGSVAALGIGDDGSLEKSVSFFEHEGSSVNAKRQQEPHAHSIYAGPDNQFAYAPDLGTDEVVIYRMEPAEAKLMKAGAAKMPPGSGPRHMKFSTDGKLAYVLSELTLTVVAFSRDPESGQLSQKQVVSVLPDGESTDGMTCSEILVSSDGRFVYTANRDTAGKGRDSLSVLKVLDGGGLERIQTIGAEVSIPRNINLSPSGKWLLVAGQKAGGIPVFSVGENGMLAFSDQRVDLNSAMCVVFHTK